jgi:Predicted transcriptional regulators
MINGKKLRSYRERANLTQTELAKRVGIAQTYYSRIERGVSSALQETLQAIIQTLKVSISDIWDDEDTLPLREPSTQGSQNIIIEHGTGRNKKRYILPPTPETYDLVRAQMKEDGDIDPRLQAIMNLWDSADEAIKDELFAIFSEGEQIDAKSLDDESATV